MVYCFYFSIVSVGLFRNKDRLRSIFSRLCITYKKSETMKLSILFADRLQFVVCWFYVFCSILSRKAQLVSNGEELL